MTRSESLSYPIGTFSYSAEKEASTRAQKMEAIEALPGQLRAAVAGWSEAQLNTPYRPDGWTVRQLIHHIADSHMNAFIRFKLILTEEKPPLKPYVQDEWANLADNQLPINVSLQLLEALHQRWVAILSSIEDWEPAGFHPEHGKELSLDFLLALYSWHGRHHLAHIKKLAEREGW